MEDEWKLYAMYQMVPRVTPDLDFKVMILCNFRQLENNTG